MGTKCATVPEPAAEGQPQVPDKMNCRNPIEMSEKSGKAKEAWPFLIASPKTVWREGVGAVGKDTPEAASDSIERTRRFIKYPYSLHTLVFKMLEDEYGVNNVVPEMLPSLACPDCPAYSADTPFKSKEFSVITKDVDDMMRAPKTSSPEMFPTGPEAGHRTRYFVEPNIVLGGLLLRQERSKTEECASLYPDVEDKIESTCRGKASTTADFGVDPTFVSTSRVYRATNALVMNEKYDEKEINSKGIPYGFFNTQTRPGSERSSSGISNFPVLFDINMNSSRVADVLTYLKDGNYIDASTKILNMDLLIFNRPQSVLGKVSVSIMPRSSGGLKFSYSIDVLDTELYDTKENALNSVDTLRKYLEIAFVILLIYLLLIEFVEIFEMGWAARDVFAYFKSMGNALDLGSYFLQLVAMQLWHTYVKKCKDLDPQRHWDVYNDYVATSRFFEAGPEMAKYLAFVEDFNEAANLKTTYTVVVALILFCVCFQSLKNINFHPRLGIVTRTIALASGDLTFFLVLFCMIAGMYAFFGCLVFGNEMDRFSSFAYAFASVLEACIGQYNPVDEPEFTLGKMTLAQLYFWSYICISFFILLNALLAIVVEAYDKVQTAADEESKQDPLNFMIYESTLHLIWPKCSYVRITHLQKLLEDASSEAHTNIRPWRLGCCLGAQLRHGLTPHSQSKKLLIIPKDILEKRFNTIVLDQDAVATAVEISLPACTERTCQTIAYNLMELLGTAGVDKDGDGKISDLEMMAFKDGQELDLESEIATYDDKMKGNDGGNAEEAKQKAAKRRRAVRLRRMMM
jgi:hypothetical protein